MNKRPFLFGLGVGIIVGAALLQLMLIGERQFTSLNDYTKQDSETDKMFTQEELDSRLAEERARIEAELKASISKDESKKAEEPIKSVSTEEKKADTPIVQKIEVKAPKRIIVRIPPNSTVTQTAELLVKKGVIKEKMPFVNLMRKVIIRAGYFSFEGSPTLQEIKTIVTSQPIPPSEIDEELKKSAAK